VIEARLVTVAPTLSPMPNGKPLSGASGAAEFASSAIAFRRIDYWLKPRRNAPARLSLRATNDARGRSDGIRKELAAGLTKKRRTYLPRIVGTKVMMRADRKRPCLRLSTSALSLTRCARWSKAARLKHKRPDPPGGFSVVQCIPICVSSNPKSPNRIKFEHGDTHLSLPTHRSTGTRLVCGRWV
jgi:hypothetical protein